VYEQIDGHDSDMFHPKAGLFLDKILHSFYDALMWSLYYKVKSRQLIYSIAADLIRTARSSFTSSIRPPLGSAHSMARLCPPPLSVATRKTGLTLLSSLGTISRLSRRGFGAFPACPPFPLESKLVI
jgi:hypothetical protein